MRPRPRLIDLSPLETRSFREIWTASLLTALGSQISAVAALAQVWEMTSSPIWTGAIGVAQGLPILVAGALGGSLADRFDRRSILLLSTGAQLTAAAALMIQAALGNASPLLVLAILSTQSAAVAIGSPVRRALPAQLLPASQLASGITLQSIGFQASLLIGPAIGGLLTALWLPAAYAAQVLAVPIAFLAVLRLHPLPPGGTPGSSIEPGGWLFAFRHPLLRGALLTDLATTTLSMPVAIFPVINALRFDDDPRTLGLFFSAVAVGGIGAGLLTGTITKLPRWGVVQFVCAIVWGLALVGLGMSTSLLVACICLAIAGGADTTAVVVRGSLIQLNTPDALRGRVSAVDHVVGVAGPELGNMRGGLLASAVGAPMALVVGGVSTIAGSLLVGFTHPSLRNHRADGHGMPKP